MQIRIRVRPQTGYHFPSKVDTILIDSSERLETIQEKYQTNGSSTRLYYGQYELPLNSSIGSHNFVDGAIIECCRSPAVAAALSACLKDLDKVKKLRPADRTKEALSGILQTPLFIENDPTHDVWKSHSWNDDSITCRAINFATMKAVLQRKDRYQVHDLPQCNSCQSLFDALQPHKVWTGGNHENNNCRWNQQSHIFKPQKKDGTGPTTNWILLQQKLDIQQNIRREILNDPTFSYERDYLEVFVERDHSRHSITNNSPFRKDSETYLRLLSSPSSFVQPRTPPRLKTARKFQSITKEKDRSPQHQSISGNDGQTYIPQYASGPFAILATLHSAMHSTHPHFNGQRLLTLTEDQLKRFAQPRCRSNLYDKMRIRGRNAFACMDRLIEKQFVRKEIVRNNQSQGEDIDKWGLIREGEIMGGFCADFERAVSDVLPRGALNVGISAKSSKIVICMDSREDPHYLQRMKWSCEDDNVPFFETEIPAGDSSSSTSLLTV